jgi:predicted AlkP superfamily phosphohydrolase/phosphomutase
MAAEKVLIIGLDGATWTVLEPWIKDGTLPQLARLRARGCWGDLRSTIPPLTAPAWSSLLTGKNPGKHGVFHFVALDDEPATSADRAVETVDSRSIQSSTLWDILGHYERRVGVMNVPMSYPPRPVNGFMIGCMLTPPGARNFTYPPELASRLSGYQIDLDRFIDHKPFARDEQGQKLKREIKPDLQLVREFYEMEEKRALTAQSLMGSEPWDVFMVVFAATDRMGHYLWPYHRAADLDGSELGQELHEAIRRLYIRLDEHIGAMADLAGPEAAVIIMSDHGMGPIYHKNTHWNNWLYRQGYLSIDQSKKASADAWLLRLGIPRDKIRRLAQRVPGLYRSRAFQKAKAAPTAAIDYARSQAYYVRIFDPVGGVRLQGAGSNREALRDELMEAMSNVVDPDTGRPVIRQIFRREDCYAGPRAAGLPDIILVMCPEYGSSDRLSNYSAIVTDRPQIGDPGGHHLEGIFVATGAGIQRRPEPLAGLKIEDVAPAVLHLLGLPVPSDMDGTVPPALLDEQTAPLPSSPPLGRWPSEAEAVPLGDELRPDDREAVRTRLRALGYLD